jgi:transglutaminase-like putative cysteine protease
MPRFKINHITKYSYQVPVIDSANQIILFPLQDEHQEVVKQKLKITNDPPVERYYDYYGNEVGSFMHAEPHSELVIDSRIEVITYPRMMPVDTVPKEEQWEHLITLKNEVPFIDFYNVGRFDAQDDIRKIVNAYDHQKTPLEIAKDLNEYVYKNFKYITGITSVETTLDEVWNLKAGVCQDFAHMLLVMLRMLGIPSRYVSGYICPNRNGMRGEGATHAWVEAYIPYFGWLGLDPTNNCIANELHVRLAVGRNFCDCSPVKGSYKGTSRHVLHVGVSVSYEDGHRHDDNAAVLTPQEPVETGNNVEDVNSYRRYMEMMQQQQ